MGLGASGILITPRLKKLVRNFSQKIDSTEVDSVHNFVFHAFRFQDTNLRRSKFQENRKKFCHKETTRYFIIIKLIVGYIPLSMHP